MFPDDDYRGSRAGMSSSSLEEGEEVDFDLQTIEEGGSRLKRRQGRVMTGSGSGENNGSLRTISSRERTTTSNRTALSASSEENGSSRKASPDVQDIIDGIVKLLGGKVHNATPTQGQTQAHIQSIPHPNSYNSRPLTSPNPYMFNPTKPFFTGTPSMIPSPQQNQMMMIPTPKPTRINNRGPVIAGQQNQNQDQQGLMDSQNSFEAIPLEALNSEFNMTKGNFGPPFPISGNGGAVIKPNTGGGAGTMEPPFKQGVPLPEMVIPHEQQNQNYHNNQRQSQEYQVPPPPQHNNYHHPQQPPQYLRPPPPPPMGPSPPPQNTRYNLGTTVGTRPPTSYNPFGFEQPQPIPHNNQNHHHQTPHPPRLPPPPSHSKKPIIKFPTEEDDEAEEMRFVTTPKPSSSVTTPGTFTIAPTPASSKSSSSSSDSSVYPTLLLSTNKDNGLVELVTQYSDPNPPNPSKVNKNKQIKPTPSSSMKNHMKTSTPTSSSIPSSSPASYSPIFYPNKVTSDQINNGNNNRKHVQNHHVPQVTTPSTLTSTSSLSIHALPTPPLRPGIVLNDPSSSSSHQRPNGPSNPSPIGVGSVEIVTAEEGQALLGGGSSNGGGPGDIFDITVTAQQNYGGQATTVPSSPGQHPHPHPDILTVPQGTEQFVSIDGKRTFFNLHENTALAGSGPVVNVKPTPVINSISSRITPTASNLPSSPSPVSTPSPSTLSPPSKNIGIGTVGDPVPLLPGPPGKTLFNSNTPVRPSAVSTFLNISDKNKAGNSPPTIIRRPYTRRPSTPPVRIDTCIVGDDSTCNSEQFEVCRTENGVSSCICRAGYARRRHREPCRPIIALVLSLKLDKFGDKKLSYNADYANPNSETYQSLEWETIHAMDASMAETTLSGGYVGSKLEAIGFDGKHAVVNTTILIQENPKLPPNLMKKELQKQMIQVLTRHRNNFGKTQLWVEGPISAVSAITDVNECEDSELNDCHSKAECINTFGSFECTCEPGYGDPYENDKRRSGRRCDTCSGKHYCNSRGECLIENGNKVCKCNGNYYGSQCDIDGEVLAVAIGASVSAVVIIGLTLACLCMWSRKWKREEQKAALMSRTLFGGGGGGLATYFGGNGGKSGHHGGGNPYQQHVSMDERLRWAQLAESSNMTGNIYVQSDPMSLASQCAALGVVDMSGPHRRSAETVDTTIMDDIFEEQGSGGGGRQPTTKRPRSRASQFQGSVYHYDMMEPDHQTDIYASRSMLHFPPPPAQFCVPMTPMGHYATGGRPGGGPGPGGFYS